MRIHLQSHRDRSGFYCALASLLARDIGWDGVEWHITPPPAHAAPAEQAADADAANLETLKRLPDAFRNTMHLALLHREPARHVLLHRIAQRLWRNPRGWQDQLHDDHIVLLEWHRQVRRDMHKTKAFVRFNRVGDADPAADRAEYVAWFEPVHHTLIEVAPFFVRRFTQMRWSILCASATVRWDGHQLHVGPGASRTEAPAPDAGEALWLTYYARIFNPARVKISAMKKEMPEIYWKNLPEARLIPGLLAQAPERVGRMIANAADTHRRLPDPKSDSSVVDHSGSLAWISAGVHNCDLCACAVRATQAVMGVGPATARIFIIGEQPGDREDITGHPFVGPSGQLLRQALREIGIDMEGVYTSPMPSNTSATTCEANAGCTKRRPRPMCSAACNGWRLSCGRSRLQPSSRWGAPPSAPSNAWPSSCRQQQCPIPRICPPWRRSVARSGGDGALRWWTRWRIPPRFFAPAQSRVPRVTSGGGRHCVWSFSAGPIKHESLHRIFHCTELRDVFLQQREQVSDMRFWPAN